MLKWRNALTNLLVAHWYASRTCQLNCPFCYSYERDLRLPALNTVKAKQMISILADNGFGAIVFTGGDPFMRSDLLTLVCFARSKGLLTAVDCNCYALCSIDLFLYTNCLNRIGVPLDGPDAETHNSLREAHGHFELIMATLRKLQHRSFAIKINTVATRQNIDAIFQMPLLLKNLHIDLWNIYQFSPFGRGKRFKERFTCSDAQFESLRKLNDIDLPFKVKIVSNSEKTNNHFLITHNGFLYTQPDSEAESYQFFETVFDVDFDVLKHKLDLPSHYRHFEKSIFLKGE